MTRAHVATVARRARDVVQRDALLIGGHPHQVEDARDSVTGTGRWIGCDHQRTAQQSGKTICANCGAQLYL